MCIPYSRTHTTQSRHQSHHVTENAGHQQTRYSRWPLVAGYVSIALTNVMTCIVRFPQKFFVAMVWSSGTIYLQLHEVVPTSCHSRLVLRRELYNIAYSHTVHTMTPSSAPFLWSGNVLIPKCLGPEVSIRRPDHVTLLRKCTS